MDISSTDKGAGEGEAFALFPSALVAETKRIAFSGTRIPGRSARIAGLVADNLPSLLNQKEYTVSVGDARGVDQAVADNLHGQPHEIFTVQGSRRQDFAKRSIKCLESILPASNALLIAFPGDKCPPKVDAQPRFSGHGSGTWGTVGLALGHGIKVLMFLPPNISYHDWCGPLSRYAELRDEAEGVGAWITLSRPLLPIQTSLFS